MSKKSKEINNKSITITWRVKDIQEVREDLNDIQCMQVLRILKEDHDASVGINWDIISIVCDTLYPLVNRKF